MTRAFLLRIQHCDIHECSTTGGLAFGGKPVESNGFPLTACGNDTGLLAAHSAQRHPRIHHNVTTTSPPSGVIGGPALGFRLELNYQGDTGFSVCFFKAWFDV